MSRKIPTKPFGANAEAKASETPIRKTTSPTSTPRKKAVPQSPVLVAPIQTPGGVAYSGGFQFLFIILLFVLAGAAGYYGVPVISQAINPTPTTRVDFNETTLNYEVGNTGRLGISVQGAYSRSDLKWVSSDYSIVDVDQGGNVFAKTPGTVIIQAFVGDGSIKDTIVINVSLPSE